MRFPALAALALGVAAMAATQTVAQTSTPWEYSGKRGELNWGKLDPAYRACSKGHEQSPIGHTVEVQVKPGSYIVAGGMRYDLVQFHFHHPGEAAVKGKLTDMEAHLVHKSADGKLAVVAVRLRENIDAPNAVLAALWPHLPKTAGATDRVTEMVNAGGLLPADRGYWTYVGSLTAPPCTEGVRWFVFEEELTVSRDQVRAFAALYKMNTRDLQDPHGRHIEANE